MAHRPSEPVLAWLRKLMSTRNTSTAALAERVGIPRARLRKVLAGTEPMLVDDLLAVSKALEISPADLGLPEGAGDLPEAAATPPAATSAVDPWGNQPAQLLKIAFDLGCNVQFSLDVERLADSGVPEHVLRTNAARPLSVHLDAAYHAHMEPRFSEEALTIVLGFDALYTCRLPWSAFREVTFWPAPWEGATAQPTPAPAIVPEPIRELSEPGGAPGPAGVAPEPTREPRERPRLRLVQPEDGEP